MSLDRTLTPGDINRRRRRLPEHVQVSLDDAYTLLDTNNKRLRRLAEALLASNDHELRSLALEALADNGVAMSKLTYAQLGRPDTGRKD